MPLSHSLKIWTIIETSSTRSAGISNKDGPHAEVSRSCGGGGAVLFYFGQEPAPVRPKAGKVQIFKEADLKPGMKGYAWTVLQGSEPEAIPMEILGIYLNQWGPKQDVILAKLGGKGQRTNVAAGMSGSPVYIDGKLVGAIALRFSTFSPDALCGITPIELMLEVNEFDASLPSNARTPGKNAAHNAASAESSGGPSLASSFAPLSGMVPIETPLNFAGFNENVVPEFAPEFQQMGMTVAGGGAASTMISPKPVAGWQQSLQPGDAVSGILVTGDMSISAMCTVTYNDGKHVLFCGHSFFNLGPVDMPMAKANVITTLASQYQPTKFGNATEIVGALKQDRHSGVLGDLGETADMVPVTLKVRSFGDNGAVRKERDLHFSVFVQQKWTPYLMMMTLFNSISSLNEFAEETTYRLSGKVALDGQPGVSLSTMLAANEGPAPVPNQLAGWWGDKFNRLFLNPVQIPKLKSVDAMVDILPDRRDSDDRERLDSSQRSGSGNRSAGEGFRAPLPRRTHRARFHAEDSGRLAQGRASRAVQRRRHPEPAAERRRHVGALHRYQADCFAHESGTQQQQTLRFVG